MDTKLTYLYLYICRLLFTVIVSTLRSTPPLLSMFSRIVNKSLSLAHIYTDIFITRDQDLIIVGYHKVHPPKRPLSPGELICHLDLHEISRSHLEVSNSNWNSGDAKLSTKQNPRRKGNEGMVRCVHYKLRQSLNIILSPPTVNLDGKKNIYNLGYTVR